MQKSNVDLSRPKPNVGETDRQSHRNFTRGRRQNENDNATDRPSYHLLSLPAKADGQPTAFEKALYDKRAMTSSAASVTTILFHTAPR